MHTKRNARCPLIKNLGAHRCQCHMPPKRDTGYPPKDHVPSKIKAGFSTRCQLVIKMPRNHQKYHRVPTNIPGGTQNARLPPNEMPTAHQSKCQVDTKRKAGWISRWQLATTTRHAQQTKCWVPNEIPGANQRKCCVVKGMPGCHLVKNSG